MAVLQVLHRMQEKAWHVVDEIRVGSLRGSTVEITKVLAST